AVRGLLPSSLQEKVPDLRPAGQWPAPRHARRMIALAGCAQPAMAPSINTATARVLDAIGISLVEPAGAGCCGAVRFHLNDQEGGRTDARRNIDAWWPAIERGEIEAIVMTASGCGVQVKDYGHLLAQDAAYAEKAARVAALTKDVSEIVAAEGDRLAPLLEAKRGETAKVAFQSPCTLQHGQQIRGVVEKLLTAAGFELTPVRDGHLCCGSAGTYSILQPELSKQLRANKLEALGEGGASLIASANIGCMTHLQGGTATPVRHWVELIDERLHGAPA
ncbi:MAG TPA: glycolate oxidase subunit GlcF, partial [Aromatoleum sp.]|uniref:glycolate oxidase subunit GlcF n=1 Tax=Aromatoleum sp. TaxID=2307007 RepID=UPI002B4731BB